MMDGSIPPMLPQTAPPAALPTPPTPTVTPITTTTTTTSSSSSAASIFRPRRSDDWHEYRPRIEQLYRNNQLKLRDVKKIMEREHNFVASEKQYKDRLAAWHVRKNIKAKEVHFMLRKQQKRASQGKQTAFRVAGQPVDTKRISRFVRRYGATMDNSQKETLSRSSPDPDTPSDMSCYTPEPEEKQEIMSPLPESQTHSHDGSGRLESIPDSEFDVNSLATLSPTLPAETPKPAPDLTDPGSWASLADFQNRLNALHKTLEESMSEYITPHDD